MRESMFNMLIEHILYLMANLKFAIVILLKGINLFSMMTHSLEVPQKWGLV